MTEGVEIIPISGSRVLNANMTAIAFGKRLYVHDSGKGLQDPQKKRRVLTPHALSRVPMVIPNYQILTPYIKDGYTVSAFLVTHIHGDHTGSIKNFLEYLGKEGQEPTFYVSRPVSCMLKALRIRLPDDRTTILEDRSVITTPDQVTIRPIAVNHSTVGTMSLHYTYRGTKGLYLPDFCIDHDPVIGSDQSLIDSEFHRLGYDRLDFLICESTLAFEGFTQINLPPRTEAEVCARIVATLRYYNKKSAGIVVSGFATNSARTVAVIKQAVRMGRRVGLIGKNLKSLVDAYFTLGYLTPEYRAMIEDVSSRTNMHEVKRNYVIVTSGHQGEYLAGLTRIARDDYSYRLGSNDVVMICSRTIPKIGPTISRGDMINNIRMRRARVIDEGLHKSGHITGGQMVDVIQRLRPALVVANHGDHEQAVGWHRIIVQADVPDTRLVLAQNAIPLSVIAANAYSK